MQTAIALTFLNVVAEEEISLDELVIVLRQVMEAEGLPGFLRLLLQVLDELWALRATRQGQVAGQACCERPSYEIKDRVRRRIRTAAGRVDFLWRRLRCRHCHRQVIPMRHWLGLKRWQSKTGELERVVLEVVSEQSYRRGSRHLKVGGGDSGAQKHGASVGGAKSVRRVGLAPGPVGQFDGRWHGL